MTATRAIRGCQRQTAQSASGPLSKASDRYFKGETAFLKEVCQHSNYDEWWKARNIRAHIKHEIYLVMMQHGC